LFTNSFSEFNNPVSINHTKKEDVLSKHSNNAEVNKLSVGVRLVKRRFYKQISRSFL
jgi:hypothetical protein